MNKIYDRTSDFSWMAQDIDCSLMLMLMHDNHTVVGYQVCDVLEADMDDLAVKFANVDDLEQFVEFAVVRFVDVRNTNNVLDIPVRKLAYLYENSNELLGSTERKKIKLDSLDAFFFLNGKKDSDDYLIEGIKIDKESEELREVMNIARDYMTMGMQQKFDALAKVNLINYNREKKDKMQK